MAACSASIATRTKPRVYFGYDPKEAITKFRRWQSEQGEKVETVPSSTWNTTRLATDDELELAAHLLIHGDFPYETDIPEATFWEKVAEVFATPEGRSKPAKLTGHSRIKKLDQPDQFARNLSLREVGEIFYGKRDENGKRLSGTDSNDDQKAWNYWQDFRKAVKVANVHEVTRDKLVTYREFVANLEVSPRTVKNRYDAIGQILMAARDRRESHTEIIDKLRDSVRIICRRKAPKVPKGKPTPIDVDDFRAMLQVADTKWKAILYLMLNCGLHPGECTGLHLDDLNLKKGHLFDNRNKTTNQRCSMLWEETVEAVRAYITEYKPDGLLFVNKVGKRHPTGEFGKEFYRRIRDADKVESVTLEWFRDSGTTAASRAGVSIGAVKVWLGHSRNDVDSYDSVEPLHTQPVVDAIYAEYFSGEQVG